MILLRWSQEFLSFWKASVWMTNSLSTSASRFPPALFRASDGRGTPAPHLIPDRPGSLAAAGGLRGEIGGAGPGAGGRPDLRARGPSLPPAGPPRAVRDLLEYQPRSRSRPWRAAAKGRASRRLELGGQRESISAPHPSPSPHHLTPFPVPAGPQAG